MSDEIIPGRGMDPSLNPASFASNQMPGSDGSDGQNASGEDLQLGGVHAADLESVFDVPVRVSAVLGHTSIPVSELLRLDEGIILELDRKVGESIDILVNNRLVARGEVVMVEEKLGVTMTEIIADDE